MKNTRKVLSDQLLTVFDPDNSPSDLVYSVLNSNAPTDMEGKIFFFLELKSFLTYYIANMFNIYDLCNS